jgi:hypothetical protein
MKWIVFENGSCIGQKGSESGIIILDECIPGDVRITLEKKGVTAPYSITCGIYGWMVHTRFFKSGLRARFEFWRMKKGLEKIIKAIPLAGEPNLEERSQPAIRLMHEFVKHNQ